VEGTQLRCQKCRERFTRPPGSSRLNCYTCNPRVRTKQPVLSTVSPEAAGVLEQSALDELAVRGRENEPAGKLWAHLMRMLDQGGHSGSQAAALAARALEAQTRALAGARRPTDQVDELQHRRNRLRGA
jgi:hypothetical protein